jgi:hypothetical protein
MQVPLMHPTEGQQIGPKCCACPLTGVTVHLTPAIAITVTRPLVNAVANSRMVRMTSSVALPFISIEPRAARRDVLRNQRSAGARIGMVADPPALLSRLARDQTDDGGTIIGVGPVPPSLIGAAPGRGGGVSRRGAFFPPRCGTAHRLQRRYPPSQLSGPSHRGWPESAAGVYGAASVRVPTRGRGGPSARPWLSRAVAVPRSPDVAVFSRKPSPSRGCNTPHRPGNGRPGNSLGHGRDAAPRARTPGISDRPGGETVRATACRCCHPITRRSESLL